jgi:hypothetical protein
MEGAVLLEEELVLRGELLVEFSCTSGVSVKRGKLGGQAAECRREVVQVIALLGQIRYEVIVEGEGIWLRDRVRFIQEFINLD